MELEVRAWCVAFNEPAWPAEGAGVTFAEDLAQAPTTLIAVEALVVELLHHYGAACTLWCRALLGAVVMQPVAVLSLDALMDLPPYHAVHLLWPLALNGLLVGVTVVSAVTCALAA